jgi:hypothetical protein
MLLRPAKGRVVRIRETRGWAMLASSAGRSLALTSLALTGLAAAGVTARPAHAAVTASTVTVASPGGSVLATLAAYTDQATSRDDQRHAFDLSRFTGQQITVRFTGREASTGGHVTSFYTDDCTLNVS